MTETYIVAPNLQPTFNDKDEHQTKNGLPITYYSTKYKMGHCVVAVNEYLVNNPGRDFKCYVYRMTATRSEENYNEFSVPAVMFVDKHCDDGSDLNSHVFLTDENRSIIDPLLGVEGMSMDKYLQLLVNGNYLDLKDEYKDILFDIQVLLKEHLVNNLGQYIHSAPCMCFVLNRRTNDVFSLGG